MDLVEHARRELTRCGQYAEDPAYSESIICAVEAFAAYGGHSGGSAAVARDQLHTLLGFGVLSPITSDPDEWHEHDLASSGGVPLWQNRRDPSVFSHDAGATWYSVDGRAALIKAIREAVNEQSAENGSNTPDRVLATFLVDALAAFDRATVTREDWYGHRHEPGQHRAGTAARWQREAERLKDENDELRRQLP